jgi:Restriction endonuclease
MNFSFRPWALAHLQQAAWSLMGGAVLLLLAGWFFPELWRPAFAEQRPLGFVLLGAGALTMWLHARREAERQNQEALSSLTHSTLMPYEFAPVTLPMEDPPEAAPAPVQTLVDIGTEAPAVDAGAAGSTAFTAFAAFTASGAEGSTATAAPLPPTQWSLGLLRALEWRRFEALCEEIFEQDGYVTKSEPRGADGDGSSSGDYLWLHSRLDLQQAVRIVQCRNWSGEPVGVAAVREFLGAMVDAGLKSGALMSCGTFTAEAEALARRHGIMAVSGPDLMALVAKRPEALQRELLAVATEGDYRRPTCRRCGLKMLARPSADSSTVSAADAGPTHWVCENAPRCQGTLQWSAGPA